VQESWQTSRARLAALTRSRPSDDPELLVAHRKLKAGRLAEHVRKALSTAPTLAAEELAEIREILCPHQEGIA
jgi:hypothetical protein